MSHAKEPAPYNASYVCAARPKNRLPLWIPGLMLSVVAVASALAIVPAALPGMGADTADLLRAAIGPQPVAELESLSFSLLDSINRFRSAHLGAKPQISWGIQGQALNTATVDKSPASKASPQSAPLPVNDVTANPGQLDWQPYGPTTSGGPLMARAMLLLDPQRSYAGVALVRIDLTRLQLHIMPGSIEPAHPSQITQLVPDLGVVRPADQNGLVAAFNGGFKGIHGHYGMMVNGLTLLPPIPGVATAAIYKDGHVAIGAWGTDIVPSADMIAFRQNCPPLIEAGRVNPDLYLDNRASWGYTNSSDITWRTGLGITQDGRTLIYAVGNGTSAASLAEALSQAGAYAGMQLDINQYYAHFYTYAPVSNAPDAQGFSMAGQRLLDQMINNPHLYLTPNLRDFFYLTLK
jgi:hypothetical protein